MMLAALLDLQPSGLRVLDCGCGTGILGIAALKIGAAACTGYDIDQWSADNARHNAVINRVDQRFEALLGDASVLDGFHEEFDIVMANINRNILLSDMPSFRKAMKPEGTLLLSGFYESAVELLKAKAESLGLRWKQTRNDGEWCCLEFKG
jgi:ribosomal protein L11 methyltransferase